MPKLVKPTPQQWELLQELGLTEEEDVIIIAPKIQSVLEEKFGDDLPNLEADIEDYEFEDEADKWLAIVATDSHFYVSFLQDKLDFAL